MASKKKKLNRRVQTVLFFLWLAPTLLAGKLAYDNLLTHPLAAISGLFLFAVVCGIGAEWVHGGRIRIHPLTEGTYFTVYLLGGLLFCFLIAFAMAVADRLPLLAVGTVIIAGLASGASLKARNILPPDNVNEDDFAREQRRLKRQKSRLKRVI